MKSLYFQILLSQSGYQFRSPGYNHGSTMRLSPNHPYFSGFELATWSVAPYLCEGDQTTSYYTLRDTILVFQKKEE